ncbi:MAG: glycosyltransferase family 4 protein [Limisphaerales bacterium]
MRILIIHNTLNDSTSVSGVLKHYAFMAEEWNAAGHPTDFLVAEAGMPQLRQLAPHATLLSSDGFFNATGHLYQTWRYFPAYAWRMATAHWLRLPQRYDVVYASGQFIVEVYAAFVLAWRLKAKTAVKIQHVLDSQSKRQGLINRLFLWAEHLSVRWINRRARRVLCLTQVVARDYQNLERKLGLSPVEMHVVGCGVDLRSLAEARDRPKEFDVVFLGRMHEQKGVFDLPYVWQQVVARRPNARLLVIGEGAHRRRAEQRFAELGLSHSVTFTGGIPEPQKNELLARSRLGLSLSYEEGWGLSVTEYLATGLPVVAYALPVFEEIFPGQLVLVPPGDRAAAAVRIVELLADEARQRRLGEQGRAFARRYDYRAIAPLELAVLQSALEDKPAG